jgi:hypothetical protein
MDMLTADWRRALRNLRRTLNLAAHFDEKALVRHYLVIYEREWEVYRFDRFPQLLEADEIVAKRTIIRRMSQMVTNLRQAMHS